MNVAIYRNGIVVCIVGKHVIPIGEILRGVELVILPQFDTGHTRTVCPSTQQEGLGIRVVVIRGEMNGQSQQRIRHFQRVAHGYFSASSRQSVGLFSRAVVVGKVNVENLLEGDAVVVRDPHFLRVEQANGTLPDGHVKHRRGIAHRRIEDKILPLRVVAQVNRCCERRLWQDVGVLEGTRVGCRRSIEGNGKSAFDVVRLGRAEVALFHHQAVAHVKRRVGREVVPRHARVFAQECVDRFHDGHLTLHFKRQRIDLVVEQDVVQMPEVYVARQRAPVAKPELERVVQPLELIHGHEHPFKRFGRRTV